MIPRASSLFFSMLRNFSCLDLFASFHIRVNCWSLPAIGSPPPSQENHVRSGRESCPDLPVEDAADERGRRDKSCARLHLRPSVCENHDDFVPDDMRLVDVEGELRGAALRPSCLQAERALVFRANV